MAAEQDHSKKVAFIAEEVRRFAAAGQRAHIYKGGESHFVPMPGDRRRERQRIDISNLDGILEIDPVKRICRAEPGVTFATLLKATLPLGLLPAVVPELEGITLGGAVAGCSIESMSFKYGGFHDGCLEYEVVTGDGRVLRLAPDSDPLLFEMIHGSYGTLAILTELTFKLLPASPFVRMEYLRFERFEDFEKALVAATQGGCDFVDGIIHSKGLSVVCVGRFLAAADGPPPYLSSYRGEEIYYLSTRERTEDYLTTEEYCFRYDRECHWLSRNVPGLENRWVRRLLGRWVLGSTKLIRWTKRMAPLLSLNLRQDIVCDVFIPSTRFGDFYRWYEEVFDYFPLWVVPYRFGKIYPWVSDAHARRLEAMSGPGRLMFDCAVYGKPDRDPKIHYSRLLEKKTYELGGLKTLIDKVHHTSAEFWEVFSQPRYREAKKSLDPAGFFKGLFEKFHPDAGPS